MISCDQGNIKIEGTKAVIMAELASLVNSLIEEDNQVLTEDEVARCVELAKMDTDEVNNEINSMIQQMTPAQLLSAMLATMRDME